MTDWVPALLQISDPLSTNLRTFDGLEQWAELAGIARLKI